MSERRAVVRSHSCTEVGEPFEGPEFVLGHGIDACRQASPAPTIFWWPNSPAGSCLWPALDWGGGQGLRIKVGVLEYVQQVVRVEGRLHAFGFGAVLDGVVLPQ